MNNVRRGINTSLRRVITRPVRHWPPATALLHPRSIIRERINGPRGTHRYFDFITTPARAAPHLLRAEIGHPASILPPLSLSLSLSLSPRAFDLSFLEVLESAIDSPGP